MHHHISACAAFLVSCYPRQSGSCLIHISLVHPRVPSVDRYLALQSTASKVCLGCYVQLRELLDTKFCTLEDFKQDSRYRVPHEDHSHAGKVGLLILLSAGTAVQRRCMMNRGRAEHGMALHKATCRGLAQVMIEAMSGGLFCLCAWYLPE